MMLENKENKMVPSSQKKTDIWRRSAEFAAFKRTAIIMGTIAFIVFAAAAVFDLGGPRDFLIAEYGMRSYGIRNGLGVLLSVASFALIMVVLSIGVAIYYQYGEQKRKHENSMLLQQMDRPEQSTDSLQLASLWTTNRNQLRNYHQIVMNYAESTKKSTGLYLSIGFIFILITAAFALFAPSVTSAISSAVVATAASILTGFIARAVLSNAAASSKELQTFFDHPLEVERSLAAERLVGSFETTEKRDEARLLIIQSLTRQRPPKDYGADPAPVSDSDQTEAKDSAPKE